MFFAAWKVVLGWIVGGKEEGEGKDEYYFAKVGKKKRIVGYYSFLRRRGQAMGLLHTADERGIVRKPPPSFFFPCLKEWLVFFCI